MTTGGRHIDWRCTTKPGKIFIHIFKWPGTSFTLPDVKQDVVRAYLLADPHGAPLVITRNGLALSVSLPEKAPDLIASVLVLETK